MMKKGICIGSLPEGSLRDETVLKNCGIFGSRYCAFGSRGGK